MGSIVLDSLQLLDKSIGEVNNTKRFYYTTVKTVFPYALRDAKIQAYLKQSGLLPAEIRRLESPDFVKMPLVDQTPILQLLANRFQKDQTPEAQNVKDLIFGYFGVDYKMKNGICQLQSIPADAVGDAFKRMSQQMSSLTYESEKIQSAAYNIIDESSKAVNFLNQSVQLIEDSTFKKKRIDPQKKFVEDEAPQTNYQYKFSDRGRLNLFKHLQAIENDCNTIGALCNSAVGDLTIYVELKKPIRQMNQRKIGVEEGFPKILNILGRFVGSMPTDSKMGANLFALSFKHFMEADPQKGLELASRKLGLEIKPVETKKLSLATDAAVVNEMKKMMQRDGSADFFQPLAHNLTILGALTNMPVKHPVTNVTTDMRIDCYNKLYKAQLEKTMDLCKTYLDSRKTMGWRNAGNEKFNDVLAIYAKFRKEDAQRILDERNAIIEGTNHHSGWTFKPKERFKYIDSLMQKRMPSHVIPDNTRQQVAVMNALAKNWKYVAKSENAQFQNLSRTDINKIMTGDAFRKLLTNKELAAHPSSHGKELAFAFKDALIQEAAPSKGSPSHKEQKDSQIQSEKIEEVSKIKVPKQSGMVI